jgi:hypothetical protein
MPHVVAVNFQRLVVYTDDQRTLAITALIDADGERTDDFAEAIRFVATSGPTEVFVGNIGDWTRVTLH